MLIALSYFPITELYTGKTLGKKKAGLIVVDEAGHLPNLSQVLKRTAARLLEVNPITGGGLIAAIAVLATEDHQRLGDLWAETYVVQVAAANYHMFCAKSAWCMLVYVLRLKRR